MASAEDMERLKNWRPKEICSYLGTEVRKYRRQEKLSQEEFALIAGIPLRTYKRFEAHGKANLETFIQVLRAMERSQYLFMLLPPPLVVGQPTLEDRLRSLRARAGRHSAAELAKKENQSAGQKDEDAPSAG